MNENIQITRLIQKFLIGRETKSLLLLTGARQTGKTTLIKNKFPDLTYYNLDALEYRDQLSEISTFQWAKVVGEAIFDEIQKEPKLLDKIKYSFDNQTIKFSVLTGSAQILLLSKIRETLAGRVMIYELFPFMVCELLAKNNEIKLPLIERLLQPNDTEKKLLDISPVLLGNQWDNLVQVENYLLQWGGMPALVHFDSEQHKRNWLKSYSIAYLERDLGDLAQIQDLKPFKKFQSFSALRAANLLSFSEMARDAGISVETARRYIEYLRISYQAFLLQPFQTNLTSSLIKTPKLYWTDNGLLREISGKGFNFNDGALYENYIASEIMKYLRATGSDARLSFYRTRSGMEVDFIIETQQKLIGIEAKYRETVSEKDFSSLKKIAAAAKEKWLVGFVVYRGNKVIRVEEGLWAIPSCRLFSHL